MAEKFKVAKNDKEFEEMFGGDFIDVQALARNAGFRSTGSIKVDSLLGGGFPKGRMVELWGGPQAGKSSLATACIGQTLKSGGTACYVDLERGLDLFGESDYFDATQKESDFDPEAAKAARTSWLRKNGVDPFDPNFRIFDPRSGEQLFRFLANVVVLNKFDVVVVDSVAAVLTEKQLEGDTGEATFGAVAKLLSSEMPRLLRLYGGNPNTVIIFINQIRDKIGFMQQGQKSTGGHALEHYVGTKIRLRLVKRESQTSGDVVTLSKVQVNKSRYASAKEVEIEISGERGIDVMGELLEYAEQQGYAYSSGAWKYFFDQPVLPEVFKASQKSKKVEELDGFAGKAQGKEAAKQWMSENGWYDKLFQEAVRVGIE